MYHHKPTPSYGIILFTMTQDDKGEYSPHYLLAQRRDTIEFIDIFSPKCPPHQLPIWFSLMSHEERDRIKTYIDDFDTLWCDLNLPKGDYKKERRYILAKEKFEKNKDKYLELLESTTSFVREPAWGFPKGRKQKNETYMECALREFEEETKMSREPIRLFSREPIVEVFRGSNKRMYSTNYYLYETFTELEIQYVKSGSMVPGREKMICHEIQDLKWLDFEGACRKLNPRRCEILQRIHNLILKNKGIIDD